VLVFFDDILIYNKSWEDHVRHVDKVQQLLKEQQLYAKPSKCFFGVKEVEYLGHIVSHEGVKVDPNKIKAMMDWPIPKTLKNLRGFLGLKGYYHKFVWNYGRIATPLTTLTKKDAFSWTPEATKAFEQLKEVMCKAPVFTTPDFTKTFIVECDAPGNGIGAVLITVEYIAEISDMSSTFSPGRNFPLKISRHIRNFESVATLSLCPDILPMCPDILQYVGLLRFFEVLFIYVTILD
jgi:hypothetical protein